MAPGRLGLTSPSVTPGLTPGAGHVPQAAARVLGRGGPTSPSVTPRAGHVPGARLPGSGGGGSGQGPAGACARASASTVLGVPVTHSRALPASVTLLNPFILALHYMEFKSHPWSTCLLLYLSLFASVGQASVRTIASLPWTLFTSLLTHRLVLFCIVAHCFILWDLPGYVLAAPESALGLERCNTSLSISHLHFVIIVTMFRTNVTIYHHLISQAGWNRCNLSIRHLLVVR